MARYPRDADQLDRFWTGEMSLRRLWVLVKHLPPGSPLEHEVDPDRAYWTPTMNMLASLHEQAQYGTYVLGAVNAHRFKSKKNPVPEPEVIKRPGMEAAGKSARPKGKLVFGGKNPSSKEELAAFFGRPRRGSD